MQIKLYIKNNWQKLLDVYIFINFLGWAFWQAYLAINEKRFDYIEASFLIQNLILTLLILIRLPGKSTDKNIFNQIIAIVAFFSGALLMGSNETANESQLFISRIIIFISNILGILTLLNLGKSFGILISYRKVQSKGLYSIVRHPMYVTDILLRIGFLISHVNIFTSIVVFVSTVCYIFRAISEEKFLSKQAEYAAYMQKVKYRFIPFIF